MIKNILIILLLVCVSLAHSLEAKVVDEHIYLVPAGNVDKKVLETIKERLPDSLPMTVKVEIAPQEKMLESAYDPSRQQYSAEMILNDIFQRVNPDTRVESALVIVDVDLYSKELNFVFGISDPSKGMGIISLTRLRNEFYGQKPDNKLFLERAVKEAIRELGHAWGLSHCPDQKCVMYFSNSLSDTDKKKSSFCHECHNKLHKRSGSPLVKVSLPVLKTN